MNDYARFAQMLLNGGMLDGKRYLEPENRSLHDVGSHCRRDHPGPYYLPGPGYGFGLGFAVRRENGVAPYAGYGWRLQLGRRRRHLFLGRPEGGHVRRLHDAVAEQRVQYRLVLRNMVYAAIEKPARTAD